MSECCHPCCGEFCRKKKAPKARTPIKRTALKRYSAKPKKKKNDEDKAFADKLNKFFDEMMLINETMCENCGSYKPHLKAPYYKFLWKSCQAHILPKRNFSSIAINPINIMVLGSGISEMCFCHDDYDSNWDKASKMNIWPEVIRRFKILYPLITPEEHQFIPQILLDTL